MKFDKKRYFNLLNLKKRTKSEQKEFAKLSKLREELNYNPVDPHEDGLYDPIDPHQLATPEVTPSYQPRDPNSARRTEPAPSDYAFDPHSAGQLAKESPFVPYVAQDSNIVRQSTPAVNEPAPSYVAQDPHPMMKDPILNEQMNNYLASEGGAYGTADNELPASVPTPAQSAFAGQPMDQMDGDFGGMGEEPEPARAITPEYIAEVSAKGGSFMADGTVFYPDAPAHSDRMQKINAIRDEEAATARSNRLAAIEFDKTKMGVDSSAFYPEGTVIGGVMGTDDNAMLDENDNIVPVPPIARKAKPYRTRQQRIDDMNKNSAAVSKTEPKSKVNPETGKNTVKVPKGIYERAPYVSKSKVAKDVSNIINTTQASPVIAKAASQAANPYSMNPFASNFSPSAFREGAGSQRSDVQNISGAAAYEGQRGYVSQQQQQADAAKLMDPRLSKILDQF